jgi:hypothetical protein
VVHEQSQRLSACAEQPRTFRLLPLTMPATRAQVALAVSCSLVSETLELRAGQFACSARFEKLLRQTVRAHSTGRASAISKDVRSSRTRCCGGLKAQRAGASCAERVAPSLFKQLNCRLLTQSASGKPAVKPNPSLKLTRYGMQRKPGVRRLRHLRTPGLHCMPPRAA